MAKFGGKFWKIELSFNIGYTLGAGFTLGSSFGFNVGKGILYTQFICIPNTSDYINYIDSVYIGFIGYKIGVE